MSDELRNLVMVVGEFDPPLDLHTRILEREAELAGSGRKLAWRPPRVVLIAMAAAGVGLALLLLALAAHSRTSAPGPANHQLQYKYSGRFTGFTACSAGDMSIGIQLRRPTARQSSGAFKTTLHRRVATLVLQNASGRTCYGRPAFTFTILDRLGKIVGDWDDQGGFLSGDYVPGAYQTFSLPAVYRCTQPGPFTAVAKVYGRTIRRHGLNLSEITCP